LVEVGIDCEEWAVFHVQEMVIRGVRGCETSRKAVVGVPPEPCCLLEIRASNNSCDVEVPVQEIFCSVEGNSETETNAFCRVMKEIFLTQEIERETTGYTARI